MHDRQSQCAPLPGRRKGCAPVELASRSPRKRAIVHAPALGSGALAHHPPGSRCRRYVSDRISAGPRFDQTRRTDRDCRCAAAPPPHGQTIDRPRAGPDLRAMAALGDGASDGFRRSVPGVAAKGRRGGRLHRRSQPAARDDTKGAGRAEKAGGQAPPPGGGARSQEQTARPQEPAARPTAAHPARDRARNHQRRPGRGG